MGRERKHDGVRAASSTTISIDFYYANERQRERIKLEPTPANLKRAALHRAAIVRAIECGTFDYAATFPNSKRALKYAKTPKAVGLTTEAYLDRWLVEQKRKLKASTWDDYRKIIDNVWIPKIGQIELCALRRPDIKAVVAVMTCGNKRLTNVLSALRSALHDAVHDDELIETNPIADWNYQNAELLKEDSDVDPFTKDEQALILAAVQDQILNMLRFMFWTGLRTSELCALDWSDIDWDRGVIKITKALTQASKKIETTKTAAGRREVKLLGMARAALEAQKAYTYEAGAEIFQDPRHKARWTGDQAIRKGYWIPALERAGVRYRRPYQTRHTYASMMLTAGEHPMWVAQQMGHTDWGEIRRIYGKFIKDALPDAGGLAEKMFSDLDSSLLSPNT